MAEISKAQNVSSENLSPSFDSRELGEKVAQKIPVSEQINSLQYTSNKSDCFVVDMDRLSHLTNKDMTANSRTTLQRSLSRKGSQRIGEKKMIPSIGNERDTNLVATTTPKGETAATLSGASMPEKSTVVSMGPTNQNGKPQTHHQITSKTSTTTTRAAVEIKSGRRRFSFRRPSPCWAIDPRRILFFFATLSSIGTMLLIYFTLTMRKHREDGI